MLYSAARLFLFCSAVAYSFITQVCCYLWHIQTQVTWKSRLRSWGYTPVFFSVESKFRLDTLAAILREQTTVIVGPSGVGKSSLINALRSNRARTDVSSEGNNWFDSVGLCSLLVFSS